MQRWIIQNPSWTPQDTLLLISKEVPSKGEIPKIAPKKSPHRTSATSLLPSITRYCNVTTHVMTFFNLLFNYSKSSSLWGRLTTYCSWTTNFWRRRRDWETKEKQVKFHWNFISNSLDSRELLLLKNVWIRLVFDALILCSHSIPQFHQRTHEKTK